MRPQDFQRQPPRRHPKLEMTLFSRVSGSERREDIDELMQELRDVADALDRAERKLAAIEEMDGLDVVAVKRATTHVRLLCRADGYAVVEADEPPPALGELLELDGAPYVVDCFRSSPFPGDRRRCAVLVSVGGRRPSDDSPASDDGG